MTPPLTISHARNMDPAVLQDFFERIDADERGFFKEDVLDPDVIDFWSRENRGLRLVAATPDGAVQGFVAVLTGTGWASHVGDLRLVVSPLFRRRGLGRQLSRQALAEALRRGVEKITVEVIAEQRAAVELFQELGFEAEALLREQVRTRDGQIRDLMVLSYFVQQRSQEMSKLGVGLAVDTAIE
jgi:ribosomal protein S18 acetylase RimI-like enzyme